MYIGGTISEVESQLICTTAASPWIPAFAGMTIVTVLRTLFWAVLGLGNGFVGV